MIHFSLHCDAPHEFDGWFRNNDDFEKQKKNKFLNCPICGSAKIDKLLMAPAVATSRQKEKIVSNMQKSTKEKLFAMREMMKNIRKNADYVGEKFAEEARRMHFGETDERSIYGEASIDEVTALADEGIEVMPLPSLPEDKN